MPLVAPLLVLSACGAITDSTEEDTAVSSVSSALIADLSLQSNMQLVRTAQTGYGHYNGYLTDGATARHYATLEAACNDTSDGSCDMQINMRHVELESLIRTANPTCGGNCLRFVGYTAPDATANPPVPACPNCDNDREEVVLDDTASNSDPNPLQFGQSRYESFWVDFGSVDSAPSSSYAVISQTWQAYEGPALGPPFFVTTSNVSSSVVHLDFRYRNDTNKNGASKIITGVDLKKGQWHRIDLELIPGYAGLYRGVVLIWIDRTNPVLVDSEAINYSATDDSSYHFFWGYTPTAGGPINDFRITVGMYRPNPLFETWFWMRDIKLGLTDSSIE
jgi:hypothetical protein